MKTQNLSIWENKEWDEQPCTTHQLDSTQQYHSNNKRANDPKMYKKTGQKTNTTLRSSNHVKGTNQPASEHPVPFDFYQPKGNVTW